MAEIIKSKTLNTILRLKYDTLANWKAANEYVPMKGEVCIVAVPSDAKQVASEPAILFKVGDGTGVVFKKEGSDKTELPWASGLAADVHAWAKAKDKPTYKAEEITITDTTLLKSANVEGALSEIWNKIASITGEETGTGTIAQQIAQGIAALGSAAAADGNYVAGVKVENGKLVLTEKTLPVYAAKDLETTVSALREEFDAHTAAVAGYDSRITAAQTKAEEGVANAATAQAAAEAAASVAQTGVNNAATAQARADAAYTLADGKVDKNGTDRLITEAEANKLANIADNANNYDDTEVRGLIADNAEDIAAILDGSTAKTIKAVEDSIAGVKATAEAAATKTALDEEITRAKKAEEDLAAKDLLIDADIDVLEGKVTTLIGNDSNKSVRTIANEELAAQLIAEGAAESLDTLKEIAAWIQKHPNDASAMNAAIEALQAKTILGTYIEGEEEKEYATVKAYVEAAIAALKIGDYALAADLTTLAGRVTDTETAITNITKADGLIATAKSEAIDAASKDATSKANKALEDAKAYTDAEIDKVNTEVAKKANDADLAAIAKTGNVNDLVQTTGEVLVLFGGNAAGWTE